MALPVLFNEQMAAGRAPNIMPLTVEQYHQMITRGILRDGESIELIDGILVRKDRSDRGGEPMSHGPRHGCTIVALQESLDGVKAAGCHLRIQLPVTLDGIQEPEPDVGVIRGKRQGFLDRHPGPADILALMEVSDSSLIFDQTTKQRLYANFAIPIYWIINLVDGRIEVYQDPQPAEGKYARRADYRPGETVVLAIRPGMEIAVSVADVLPS